jgi:hypothetical protein
MSTSKKPLDIALDYIARGWCPLPVKHGTKALAMTGALEEWRITATSAGEHFNGHDQNIGVLLGTASGGLVDVDLDDPLTLHIADRFLPHTDSVFGRSGKPKSHRLYKIEGDPGTVKQFADDDGMLVEYRSDHFTVFPGSTHTSGEPIEWVCDGEPAVVDRDDLMRAIGTLAVTTAVAKRWNEGNRDNLSAAVSGALLRAGAPTDVVKLVIETVCDVRGEDARERKKHLEKIPRFARKLADNPKNARVPGLPKLEEATDAKFVARLKKWLSLDDEGEEIVGPSDDDLALAFADKHANDLRHVAVWGQWLIYDGKRWAEDETIHVMHMSRVLCREIRDALLPTLTPKEALHRGDGMTDTVCSGQQRWS